MKQCEMNKTELMDRAVNEFKGTWPCDETSEMPRRNERLGVCIKRYIEEGEAYAKDSICLIGKDAANDRWQIICDQEEFEAYVSEKKQRYIPPVGERCEFSCGGKWFSCEYIGKRASGSFVLFRHDKGEYLSYHPRQVKFRPLKTQVEKDTEAAFDLVKDAADLYQACEILVKAGYKDETKKQRVQAELNYARARLEISWKNIFEDSTQWRKKVNELTDKLEKMDSND